MTNRKTRKESAAVEETTRARILRAATERFSRDSYEATALRDLAADVGVDVAYVHRCFGSKEKLFGEALLSTVQRQRTIEADGKDLASSLAQEMLRERDREEIHPLDLAIRSFSSPDASRVLREFISDVFVPDLQNKRPEVSDRQATLVIAFVAGVGIIRDVLGAHALLENNRGELERILTRTIEGVLADPET